MILKDASAGCGSFKQKKPMRWRPGSEPGIVCNPAAVCASGNHALYILGTGEGAAQPGV
jgi:hypothetical protein